MEKDMQFCFGFFDFSIFQLLFDCNWWSDNFTQRSLWYILQIKIDFFQLILNFFAEKVFELNEKQHCILVFLRDTFIEI